MTSNLPDSQLVTISVPEGETRVLGQVKWFSNQLNYGFITVLSEGEHNGIDVFVHQTNSFRNLNNKI